MDRETTYNFAAGPSTLPTAVLKTAAAEMLNYNGSGMSVMEMSHRSKAYKAIFDETKERFKRLMNVPDTHEVLFLQGGGSTQFSMIPLNLMGEGGCADYAVTGNFAKIAANEAKKYGKVNIAADTSDCNHTRIPAQSELALDSGARYFYYCANNTIYGTEWKYTPDTGSVPLCCDMSSDICTRPIDFSKYAVVFAGAQKNIGPAGVTVAVVKKSLAGSELPCTPLMLSYKTMIDKDSMYNTPPCYSIYILGLVLKWIEQSGGIEAMERAKEKKSSLLYEVIDSSKLFYCPAQRESRSWMNVVFRTESAELDEEFHKAAASSGFVNIKGHRLVGGMRASCYNAMPLEGVERLADFIAKFDREH